MTIFDLKMPEQAVIPLLITIPHAGEQIPDALRPYFRQEILDHLPDTDWQLDRIFDFAKTLGATTLVAKFSRFTIDLNRRLSGKPLYEDRRFETELIAKACFDGTAIYKPEHQLIDDTRHRSERYYKPFYQEIELQIQQLKQQFGSVFLLDVHSIKRFNPKIFPGSLPDFVWSDFDGKTASPNLLVELSKTLEVTKSSYKINDPFKGGNIVRHFGSPSEHIHAFQLHLAQDLYWNEKLKNIDQPKHERLMPILVRIIEQIANMARVQF